MLLAQPAAAPIARAAATVLESLATGARRRVRSGSPNRTGAPVRRDSLEEGTFEDTFFIAPAPGEADQMIRAARKALDAGRRLRRKARATGQELSRSERNVARLTAAAVRIFEEICTFARVCEGKVYPSYDKLEEKTGLGRRTVARSIPLLVDVGWLIKQRRCRRVSREGPGPRFEQTSNAYRPLLPKALLAFLPRWMRPPPLPDDQVQREADRRAEDQRMFGQLNCRELARATITSGPLADVLAQLGGRIDDQQRECRDGTEPQSDSSI